MRWPWQKKTPRSDAAAPQLPYQAGAARKDGFVNQLTGQGIAGVDKTVGGTYYAGASFQPELLGDLYSGNDLAALVVDIVPDEALRLGVEVHTGDKEEDAELSDWMKSSELLGKLGDAARWGRLYGFGCLVLGTKDAGEPEEPLDLDTVRSLDWIDVLDRTEVTAMTWDPSGVPKTYMITPLTYGGAGEAVIVHASRLVIFGGAKTTKRARGDNAGFDLSVLQRVYQTIEKFEAVFTNMGVLLADGNQAVFGMAGLANAMAGDTSGEEIVQKRFQIMQAARSMHRALVLDAGDPAGGDAAETFTRQTAQFSGLAQIVDKFILRLSSATRIPASVLMGQSPAGLSATGEADLRWFYDRTDAYREGTMEPALLRVIKVKRSSQDWTKRSDGQADVVWPRLWSESDSEAATARKTQADSDAIYMDRGVLSPEEVGLSRFGGDTYSFETDIPDEGIDARSLDLEKQYAEPEPDTTPETSAAPTDEPDDQGDEPEPETGGSSVQLAPTDIASVITVNEARASQALGPLRQVGGGVDPDGQLTVQEFKAKRTAKGETEGTGEGAEDLGVELPDQAPAV